jgi:hypothetical protein
MCAHSEENARAEAKKKVGRCTLQLLTVNVEIA